MSLLYSTFSVSASLPSSTSQYTQNPAISQCPHSSHSGQGSHDLEITWEVSLLPPLALVSLSSTGQSETFFENFNQVTWVLCCKPPTPTPWFPDHTKWKSGYYPWSTWSSLPPPCGLLRTQTSSHSFSIYSVQRGHTGSFQVFGSSFRMFLPHNFALAVASSGMLFLRSLHGSLSHSSSVISQVFSARPFPATLPQTPDPTPILTIPLHVLFSPQHLSVYNILYICTYPWYYCLSPLLECKLREAKDYYFYVCCCIPIC